VLQESFDAREALALIERARCSIYYGMPNMARAFSDGDPVDEITPGDRAAHPEPTQFFRAFHQHNGRRLTCNRAPSCALTATFPLTDQKVRL
jgi:hypothetical protein